MYIGGAALGATLLLGLWLAGGERATPGDDGLVQINAVDPAIALPENMAATAVPTSGTVTVLPVLAPPSELHAQFAKESRDVVWANRSEASIKDVMRSFGFLGGAPLKVQCASSVCEISGVATAQSTEAVKLIWQELEQFTQSEKLSPAGLMTAAATFGSAENPYAFVLHYRRDDALAAANPALSME